LTGQIVLFGGPAGAGKSTLARLWCASRERAVHIELDAVRSLIVAGAADPQEIGSLQSEQYELSVAACCALANVFLEAGYDVAIDDVLEPEAYERCWLPALGDVEPRTVIVLPELEEVLRRGAARTKQVKPELIQAQHTAIARWPEAVRFDTTGKTAEESLQLLRERGRVP
jgi:predicted kinase